MKDLFYSQDEKIVFWVAGYCRDLNTDSIVEKVKDLQEMGQKLADVLGVKLDKIRTYEVHKSRRYLNMRVFYANEISQNIPENAFKIGGIRDDGSVSDWTMSKWVHD